MAPATGDSNIISDLMTAISELAVQELVKDEQASSATYMRSRSPPTSTWF